MSASQLRQFQYTYEVDLVHDYSSMILGATGAVGTVKGANVSKIVRNSAGNYTITYKDQYQKFEHADFHFQSNVSGGSGVASVEVKMNPLTLQATYASTNTITIQCYDYAGAAVDPSATSKLKIHSIFRKSSLGFWD